MIRADQGAPHAVSEAVRRYLVARRIPNRPALGAYLRPPTSTRPNGTVAGHVAAMVAGGWPMDDAVRNTEWWFTGAAEW